MIYKQITRLNFSIKMNADIERFEKCYYVQITLPPRIN